jgi:hypothetical protein
MLLLFPCPGTIPTSSCRPSCQMSCCSPPLSGCAAGASSLLSTAPMTAPMQSCGMDPAPSPSQGGRMRSSPSAASRPARKPHLAACDATADRQASVQAIPRHKGGIDCRPTGFSAFSSSGAAQQWSRNCFSGRRPVFCMSWTGGAIPVSTASVPAPSAVTASEIWPLTSPHAGWHQSSGLGGSPVETWLHPWLTVKPVWCTV